SVYTHTCALLSPGKVRCWGDNTGNALGYSGESIVGDNETPQTDALFDDTFNAVVTGWNQTCARLASSPAYYKCWGGTPSIPLGIEFSGISGGEENWCGIQPSGNVRCAGTGSDGRLGYGNTTDLTDWPSDSVQIETPGYTLSDPLYAYQWHLHNTGQLGGTSGEDINVVPVWDDGALGTDIFVSIVDDGVEITHPDLYENIAQGRGYNYLDGSDDPTVSSAFHGTCVAGLIGARDSNGFGVRGAAPRATLAGYNMLQNSTISNIADAAGRNSSDAYISNNSWGPSDGLGTLTTSVSSWKTAVDAAVTSGRGGKGTSFFWAAGNGAFATTASAITDLSTYDGYASYYATTAVCAVGDDGVVASYSEPGANIWVCAPSQGNSGVALYTTDQVGQSGMNVSSISDLTDRAYTKFFNGTSGATPIVSGVAALVYETNPTLSWRDMRMILARSARKNDASNSGWGTNAASPTYNISYDYGFGVVDADAAVTLAQTWTNVGALENFSYPTGGVKSVASAIPDNDNTGVSSSMTVSGSGISKIEYVEIQVDITHTDWGNLRITLQRDDSITTSSILAIQHDCYNQSGSSQSKIDCTVSGNTFKFGSARHLGEPADGVWKLVVKDSEAGTTGTFTSWRLKFYGE
ncbi:S8 family serine peptidase, partial [bacterium]|nr:S8 family serine peptidase [bacterium]